MILGTIILKTIESFFKNQCYRNSYFQSLMYVIDHEHITSVAYYIIETKQLSKWILPVVRRQGIHTDKIVISLRCIIINKFHLKFPPNDPDEITGIPCWSVSEHCNNVSRFLRGRPAVFGYCTDVAECYPNAPRLNNNNNNLSHRVNYKFYSNRTW